MSFGGRTPESLLPRSDSKNPATTCRGITSTGRPCRRALAASPRTSPAPSPSRDAGVLAVLDQQNAAAFYCWQHKEQAEHLAASSRHKTSLHPLKEKSSIDTLVERVCILELDEIVPEPRRHRRRQENNDHRPTRRETLPSGWAEMQSPLMKVPEEMVQYRPLQKRRAHSPRSNVKLSWSCCIQADDDNYPPPRTHQPREKHNPRPQPSRTAVCQYARTSRPEMSQRQERPSASLATPLSRPSPTPLRPSPAVSVTHSQTQTLLSLIPSSLSPQTTSLLLTELSRPTPPTDDTGYIYIFWLTPESEVSKPDDETASSLLDDEDNMYTARAQRTNQAIQRYASVRHPQPRNPAHVQRTMMLKIGRAENVHRRMTQWTKQCGQNITLIRYYPYTGTGLNHVPGRKVPHVHRVERLIHLELAEKRVVKSECDQCGRVHQEWFEIEATRAGLRGVDEVVKRWVAWAERQ
ncbi:hypothetical protein PV05_04963 [Exophiala xenobiotica]|uniref:Bacteriophage T5 Orf172 DNA-binding domain-containing protein n=1 Tax=Exophiala xenobiotica TaxID=348802 RepID=A0A0D2ELG2_9EURO|nr:uncharacterized protein PV05_04963 [Exophiala xenobiotica]KIW56293.1 hypothetical protein PV05_04963 [Exophiala xenobiotica]